MTDNHVLYSVWVRQVFRANWGSLITLNMTWFRALIELGLYCVRIYFPVKIPAMYHLASIVLDQFMFYSGQDLLIATYSSENIYPSTPDTLDKRSFPTPCRIHYILHDTSRTPTPTHHLNSIIIPLFTLHRSSNYKHVYLQRNLFVNKLAFLDRYL